MHWLFPDTDIRRHSFGGNRTIVEIENRYWTSARSSVSRRRFLGGSVAVGAGLAGAALIGCGSGDKASTPAAGGSTPAGASGGSGAATAAATKPAGPTVASITGDTFINREPNATPKYGGTLNWSPGSPVLANLDPLHSTSAMVHQVSMPSYSTLMHIGRQPDDRNSPTIFFPELATKWEVTSPTQIVFHLREGVKFHNIAPVNGRVFNAEDAKYAIERAMGEKSRFKGAFRAIKSLETPDDKTLIVNMTSFAPLMMSQLAGHFAWMVPKEIDDDKSVREQQVGTGPFVFQKWEQDARVNYKKNPDYFIKGAPFIDELNWFIIGNQDTRTAAYQSGQTQIYDVPQQSIKDFKGNDKYTVEDYLRVEPRVLFMKADDPRWADDRVRKAVALALDTQELMKIMVEGNGAWRGIVSGQHAGWTLSQEQLKSKKYFLRQDLAEAKKLIAASGQKIDTGLLFNTSYPQSYQDAVQYVAQTLTSEGIATVKAYGQEHATMRKNQDEHNYDGLVFGLDGQGAPESFLLDFKTGGPKNGSGLSNKEVDADVDKVMTVVDPKERQEATKVFIDKWLQQVMYKIEFVDGTNYTSWSKDVHNFVDGPPFWYQSGHQYTWLDKA